MGTRVQLIGDNSVNSGSIINSAVLTEDILDGAVTTAKIANSSVTTAKLAPGVAIPTGVIVMWSGSTSNIPSGWALCNGANGTPDLRDRFVVGAGLNYNPGNTGGSNSVTLTEGQMPYHNHGISDPGHYHSAGPFVPGGQSSVGGGGNISSGAVTLNTDIKTTGITVNSTGGSQAHENRPPYYALAYIMKS
jgi:microcystin-dependent protein